MNVSKGLSANCGMACLAITCMYGMYLCNSFMISIYKNLRSSPSKRHLCRISAQTVTSPKLFLRNTQCRSPLTTNAVSFIMNGEKKSRFVAEQDYEPLLIAPGFFCEPDSIAVEYADNVASKRVEHVRYGRNPLSRSPLRIGRG